MTTREQRLEDYRVTFSTPAGQRVLADLRTLADRAQLDVHSDRPADALKMACLEGHRQLYLRIVAVVDEAIRFASAAPSDQETDTYLTLEEPAHAG